MKGMMMEKIRVAISGFGRIGRDIAKIILEADSGFELVGINDLASAATLMQLFQRDTILGKYSRAITQLSEDSFLINGQTVKFFQEKDPAKLPWAELNVDIAVESTGIFRKKADAFGKPGYDSHLRAGEKRLVLTVPAKDEIKTIVMGVNEEILNSEDLCVSNASCTTNCLAPIVKVIDQEFGIIQGNLTTIHAVTNDQTLCDKVHKDLRRARGAYQNIVPTSTGAAKAIGLVLPNLDGKLVGKAIRVPISVGSLIDLTLKLSRGVTAEVINRAIFEASQTSMKGTIEYSTEELVSSDIVGNPTASIFDSLLTVVNGDLVNVVAWYDNEWGYSNQTVRLMKLFASKIEK
jgi:glyceraldehyde 3-phosphate dehydrogenase